jgi:hypothetical protein
MLPPTLAWQGPMSKAEEYRNDAATCRKQSETAINPDEKGPWLKIANEWLQMADAADRNPDAY